MLRFLLRRLALAMLVALSVSVIIFTLLNFSIDPALAMAGEDATDEDIQALREAFGFDRPPHVRYLSWLGNVLMGDFGVSPYFGLPVSDLILDRLPVTLTLAPFRPFSRSRLGCRWGCCLRSIRTRLSTGYRCRSRCSGRRFRTSGSVWF